MTATCLSQHSVSKVQALITVIVVPQEGFSYTQQSLDSIYQHTKIPFELVYVDVNSPRHIQKYLERAATQKGFTLLRCAHFLSPNQARNLGLSQVTTDYVVFIDNDIHVSPGWLEHLWQCAQETNAAVGCPLICLGKPLHDRIYLAGGEARIFMDIKDGQVRRRLHEEHFLANRSAAAIKSHLNRRSCKFVELNCTLVRREIFDHVGCLDEKLLGTQEAMDFCLRINQTGNLMICEPASVVTHVPQTAYHWSNLAYFMLRWSDTWEVKSLTYFQQKWDLDTDSYFLHRYKQVGHRRHREFLSPLRWLTKNPKFSWLENLAIGLEQWFNQIITHRHARLSSTIVKKLTPTAAASPNQKIPVKQPLQQSALNRPSTPQQLSQPHLIPHS